MWSVDEGGDTTLSPVGEVRPVPRRHTDVAVLPYSLPVPVETSYQRGDKFVRLITVLDNLQRSQHGKTTRELANQLGVNVRSVQRDIKQMEQAGLDIERDDDKRVRIGESSRLPPLQFTKPEGVAVLIALRLLQQMRTSRDDALIGAVGRLAQAMRISSVVSYLGTMLEATERLPEGAVREHIEQTVVQCFMDRVPCEIEYENFSGELSQRVIHPYFLEPRPESRTIYVYAHDAKTSSMRWFRVDRIRKVRDVRIGGTYSVPESFDITDVTRSSWGIWQAGDELQEVVLHFQPEAVARVRETVWHPGASLSDLPGGGVAMRLSVASEIEMRPCVLGWGAQVEIVAPGSLREHCAESMRAGVRMYDRQVSPD